MSEGGAIEPVGDEEALYRSVKVTQDNFKYDPEEGWRISSQAFADRRLRPSVYRHNLCPNACYGKPPRFSDTDAILRLVAKEVRQLEFQHPAQSEPQNPSIRYIVDVIPDISNDQHPAHAIVVANPLITATPKRLFERLKERLCRLALSSEWSIPPDWTLLDGSEASAGRVEAQEP